MSRPWAALVAALALGAALPNGASAQASTGPGPAVDPGTKLAFPASVGGAQLTASSSLGAGGTTYAYAIDKMNIFVYIFNGGRRVPTGSDTLPLMNQFTIELNEAAARIKSAGYSQVDRPTVPSTCVYGNVSFRCLVYSASGARGRFFSKLLMTGYHDNFLKIRIDWAQVLGQTSTDAENALKGFLTALMHQS
jgi:hypothetical protein